MRQIKNVRPGRKSPMGSNSSANSRSPRENPSNPKYLNSIKKNITTKPTRGTGRESPKSPTR